LAQGEVTLNVEEALELIDKTMERVKSLYEQYFLGIQKQPPTFIHNDLERKLRDLQQVNIRNTALRYRYATLQQKFGSYNSYWRRTLRQIENGTYARSLAKIGRKAIESGQDIPEEILAKMPKRMREQVRRDREAAIALAERRNQLPHAEADDGDFYEEFSKPAGRVDARGAHVLSAKDADIDLDAYFAQVEAEDEHTTSGPPPQEFEELVTPPVAVIPSGPAKHRAASLGGLPRAQSPAVRAQTNPGMGTPTPPAFNPTGSGAVGASPRATGSQRAVTEPDPRTMSEPDQRVVGAQPLGRPSVPMPANPSASGQMPAMRPSQPGQPAAPARPSQPGQAPQSTPAMRPSAPRVPMPASQTDPSQSNRGFAPSQVSRPNPIAPGSSMSKQVAVESMQGPFAREPSVVAPPRRSKRDTDIDMASEETPTRPSAPAMPAMPTPPAMRPVSSSTPVPAPPSMKPVPTPPRPLSPATPSRPVPQIGRTTPTGGNAIPPQLGRTTPTGGNAIPPQLGRTTPTGGNAAITPGARPPVRPTPTPGPRPPTGQRPPPGMTDDDVNNLYAKYVKAKEAVGEQTGPTTYGKLLNTINAQAPKIMEQYKAKGVDFSVVVKDNQVIIKAKPKP
jgi:hypothetical protein